MKWLTLPTYRQGIEGLHDDNDEMKLLGYVEQRQGRWTAIVWGTMVRASFDDKEDAKAWLVAVVALEAA